MLSSRGRACFQAGVPTAGRAVDVVGLVPLPDVGRFGLRRENDLEQRITEMLDRRMVTEPKKRISSCRSVGARSEQKETNSGVSALLRLVETPRVVRIRGEGEPSVTKRREKMEQ